MKNDLKRALSLLLALSMVLVFASCSDNTDPAATPNPGETATPNDPAAPADSGAPVGKNELIVALPGEPSTLDPYAHTLYYGFIPAPLIFDTLISKDENGEFQPELATEWSFTDDTTLVFKLREGVTFSNGNKFTAEDVKYTLQKAVESTFSGSLFDCIDLENTTITNDTEIVVKLKYAYAPLLDLLTSFRGGILDHISYEADPDAYGHSPIGTGPMKLINWVSGDRIELEANSNYWGEPLAYSKCVFRVIVESSSRTIELETGGVDIAVEVPFSDWSRVEDAPTLNLVSGQTNILASLVFNNSYDTFKDERVRKALAYGLDLNALVQTVWEGTADVADSYYARNLLGYKVEGPMGYDVEKAKTLLAEAGYPNGFDLTYTTYQTTLNQAFAEVLQSMWGQIGVNVKIDIVDLATFTSMNNNGELTAALLTPSVAIADPAAALLLWPVARTISLRHNDQHIQDLLDAGSSTYDTDERAAIYQELQDYLYEKTYTVPVAYTKFAFGIQDSVQGFTFDPSQVPDLTRVYFG
ncbi:MAG TPA: ABC transporter substrate-binding protein [Clostridia bacterium]|nr:ABC transporter substrate-binding protein [Clostridia bacterium]